MQLKNYINGVLWGIRVSIKVFSRCKDIKEGIFILCKIQNRIEKNDFDDNTQLWCAVEKIIYNIKY